MSNDPPASDLGAIRMRLDVLQAMHPGYRLTVCDQMDIARLLAAYDAQAARLADIWLQVDLWEQGTEGGLETLERLVTLRETGHVD